VVIAHGVLTGFGLAALRVWLLIADLQILTFFKS
jgi:hypothetical protein